MKKSKPTYHELELQLAEARGVIGSLTSGQADAILTNDQVLMLRLKKTEDALRQSEEEKTSILNNTVEAIAYYDLEHNLQWANRAYLEVSGKTLSEVKGIKCHEFRGCERFCPECPVGRSITTRMPHKSKVNSKYLIGWPQKSKTWLISAVPVDDKNGRPAGVIEVAHDISDQIQAEEKLKALNRLFQGTFDNAAVGIAHLDINGSFIRVNRKFADITGYSREELIGKTFSEITHADDVARDMAYVVQLQKGLINNYVMEKRYIRKDGSVVWVSLTASFQRDEESNFEHFIAIIQDITVRKTAEDERWKSEARLHALVDNLPFEFWAMDEKGRYTVQNPASRAAGEDRIGKKPSDVAPSIEVLKLWEANNRRAFQGEIVTGEVVYQRNGQARTYHNIVAPVKVKHEIRGILGVNIDITDRKRAEESLRREAQIMAEVHDAVIGIDLNGNITRWNAGAERVFGYQREETIGRTLSLLGFDRNYSLGEDALIAAALAKGTHEQETRCRNKFDEEIFLHLTISVVRDQHNLPCGLIVYAMDISDYTRIQKELFRANEELEHRVEARTAQLHRKAEQLSKMTQELMRTEQRERLRLARILHDNLQQLLAVTKFNLSTISSGIENRHLAGLADNAIQLLDQALETTRSLAVDLAPPVLHQPGLINSLKWLCEWMKNNQRLGVDLRAAEDVDTDQEDLKRVVFESVRELLTNVVKHSGVFQATVELARRQQQILVSVSDQGRGFEPAILDMDHQEGEETKISFGLFSIRERIGGLGGKLVIKSKPGQGAKFIISLPLVLISDKTEQHTAPDPSALVREERELTGGKTKKRIRIMLVDDHTVMRQGLASILKKQEDMEIVGEAESGEEALALADQIQPDVILMDYRMPGVNGLDATRTIHARQPEIRILGLSMYDEPTLAEAMREAGAAGVLSKTSPASELLAAIRETV